MSQISLFKQLACLTISWSLMLLPVQAATGMSTDAPKAKVSDPAKRERNLTAYFKTLKAVRGEIDRSSFDLDALLEKLNFDEKAIINFVQQEISNEIYPGVMRGARGTLMSRGGNSLDQSLLLATLLKNAGLEARILRGELNDEWAKKLVYSISASKPSDLSSAEFARIQAHITAFSKTATGKDMSWNSLVQLMGQSISGQPYDIFKSTQKSTEFIQNQLKEGGVSLAKKSESADADLMAESKDYFWVEYRSVAASGWSPVHPMFNADAATGLSLTVRETYKDTIPETLHQTLEISATIQQNVQGRINEKPAMPVWKRPVANFYGEPLTFVNMPISAPAPSDPAKIAQWLKLTNTFVPMLNQEVLPGAVAFDMSGQTVAPEDAMNPAAGVVKTVGDKANKATGALASIGSGPATDGKPAASRAMELEGQTLGLKLTAPGRPALSYSRTIASRRDGFSATGHVTMPKRAFDDTDMARSLTSQYTIMLSAGNIPAAYVLDKTLERTLALESVLNQIIKPKWSMDDLKGKKIPSDWGGFLLLMAMLESYRLPDGAMSFRSQPSIVLHDIKSSGDSDLLERIDIVRNARLVLEKHNSGFRTRPDLNLVLGVRDTHVERQVFAADEVAPSLNTIDAFDKAVNSGQRIVLIRDQQALSNYASTVPAAALRAIKRDLNDGYFVFLPVVVEPALTTSAAWWRVNGRTGETLGMVGDGRGSIATEYIIILGTGVSAAIIYSAVCFDSKNKQGKLGVQEGLNCAGTSLGVGASLSAVWGAGFTPVVAGSAASLAAAPIAFAFMVSAMILWLAVTI